MVNFCSQPAKAVNKVAVSSFGTSEKDPSNYYFPHIYRPVDEKEKNQDIFSLVMTPEHLFYGCRNHYVYPLNIKTLETLSPFDPPHFDAVTSLALLEDSLVSGSRDKNLRGWDYN